MSAPQGQLHDLVHNLTGVRLSGRRVGRWWGGRIALLSIHRIIIRQVWLALSFAFEFFLFFLLFSQLFLALFVGIIGCCHGVLSSGNMS